MCVNDGGELRTHALALDAEHTVREAERVEDCMAVSEDFGDVIWDFIGWLTLPSEATEAGNFVRREAVEASAGVCA